MDKLNTNPDIDAYIIQLPIPDHLNKHRDTIFERINRYKDLDCFNPVNVGLLTAGKILTYIQQHLLDCI